MHNDKPQRQPSEYGLALKAWREQHGMSREDLSVATGGSYSTVQNLEVGASQKPSRLFRTAILRIAQERDVAPPEGW